MILTIAAAVFAAFFVFPVLAQNQPMCAPRAALLQVAYENYQEVPVVRGLASSGRMLEILAAPSGTWTLLSTTPEGTSCMMGDGQGWQVVEPKPPGVSQ